MIAERVVMNGVSGRQRGDSIEGVASKATEMRYISPVCCTSRYIQVLYLPQSCARARPSAFSAGHVKVGVEQQHFLVAAPEQICVQAAATSIRR